MNRSTRQYLFAGIVAALALALAATTRAEEAPAAAGQQNSIQSTTPAQSGVNDVAVEALSPVNLIVGFRTVLTRTDSLIGVDAAQVDEVLRSHLGLAEGKGVLVTAVRNDSPAAKAGIQKNDVLVSVADQEIGGPETLDKLLEPAAEKPTPIVLIRSGHKQTVTVTPRDADALAVTVANPQRAEPRFWLGLGLANADDTLRSHLAVAAGEGLVVTSVEADSPAAKAGVMVNDLLLKLEGKPLTTIEVLSAQLQEVGDKSVALELLRHGKPAMLTVTPVRQASQLTFAHFVDLDVGLSPLNGKIWVTDNQGHFARWVIAGNNALSFVDVGNNVVDLVASNSVAQALNQPKPDIAAQIAELREQVAKLQKSLEALDAAVKSQTPAAAAPEKAPEKEPENK